MVRDFVIMTDSCCDLPAEMVQELGIKVLPLSFLMEEKEYFNYPDNRDMDPQVFYNKLREGKLGTTSAVSIGAFQEAMEEVAALDKDILCLNFSGSLSTTYQSACIAADDVMKAHPECKIVVWDTKAAALGQGMLIWLAARKKEKGASMEQTLNYVKQCRARLHSWVTVNDLFHLKRGGRVSAASAVVGTMLQMKPIIEVSDEGKLEVRGKVRGRKVSIQHLLDKLDELDYDGGPIYLTHGDCGDEVEEMMAALRKKYGRKTEFVVNYVGPVIGNHTGPGVLAVFFLSK